MGAQRNCEGQKGAALYPELVEGYQTELWAQKQPYYTSIRGAAKDVHVKLGRGIEISGNKLLKHVRQFLDNADLHVFLAFQGVLRDDGSRWHMEVPDGVGHEIEELLLILGLPWIYILFQKRAVAFEGAGHDRLKGVFFQELPLPVVLRMEEDD